MSPHAFLLLRAGYLWTPEEIAEMPDWFVELALSKGGE